MADANPKIGATAVCSPRCCGASIQSLPMPLDSGLVPTRVAAGGLQSELSVGLVLAVTKKTVRKVRQRLGGEPRPQASHERLAARVFERWRALDEPLAPLACLDFLNYDTIRQVTTGQRELDAISAGFLISLRAWSSFLGGRRAVT